MDPVRSAAPHSVRTRHVALLALVLGAAQGCAAGAAPPATPGPAAAAESWRAAPTMRFARSAHNVVSTGTAVFALAGTGAGSAPVLEVERFDGRRWSVETRLPGEGLNAPASVFHDGRIYVIGGFHTVTNVPSDRVYVYDLASRTWSEAAPLPSPRGGHAAVVVNDEIHVVGGGNSTSTIADHTVYDPRIDMWVERAPLPRAKGSPAAVALFGRIYAIGGRSGSTDFGDVDVYDPVTDRWTAGPAIEPVGTAGAVVYRGSIYVFGGESQSRNETVATVLRLDPATGVWARAATMPTARNYARAVTFRDEVLVVGGSPEPGLSHSSGGSDLVEAFRAPRPAA